MTKKEKSEATEKKKIVKRRTTRRKKEVKTKKTKSQSNTSSESKTLDSKKSTLESKTRKSKSASKSGVTTSSIKSTDSTKKRRSRTTIEEVSSKRAESKTSKKIESKKTKNVESKKIDSKIKFKHIDIDKVDADLVGRVYNIDDSPLGGIYQNKKKFQFITSTGQMLESSVLGELISQLKPLKWCRIKWRQNKRFNVCDHTKESTMKPGVYVDTEWVSEVRDSLKA